MMWPSIIDVYRQAAALRRVRGELQELTVKYRRTTDRLLAVTTQLAAHDDCELLRAREQALQAALAVEREHVANLEVELADARRELDDVHGALAWLERDFKVTGTDA